MCTVSAASSVLSVAREGKKGKKEISREKVHCLFPLCVCLRPTACLHPLHPGYHGCYLSLTTDGQGVHPDTSESSVFLTECPVLLIPSPSLLSSPSPTALC